jgi:glutaredoxin-related protein
MSMTARLYKVQLWGCSTFTDKKRRFDQPRKYEMRDIVAEMKEYRDFVQMYDNKKLPLFIIKNNYKLRVST